jgi:hypothetical protein
MKKTISIGIVLTLVLTVVSGMIAFPGLAHTESNPFVRTLWAGQNIDVGTVSVWNNGTHINVTYKTINNWNLTETHLYVGTANPNSLSHSPGQFPYSHYIDPACDEDSYSIPLSMIDGYHLKLNKKGNPTGVWEANGTLGVDVGDQIYIAAHAVVENVTTTYDTCMIDFEEFSEYDDVSSVTTGCGEVKFFMVDYLPLMGLSIGEIATITVKDDLPVIAEESTMGSNYYGLVAFTSQSNGMKDDLVLDDSGTGAGGKMLTDALDYSQTPLLYHAYTKYQAILVNVSDVLNVDTLNFVGIDLDHNELWHFQYFDENDVLIADVTIGPGTGAGDGKAYQTDFTDSRIAKVAIWGEQNLAIPDRLGFAIDNIEVDTKTVNIQEETAWGDGDEFSTNWAMFFTYEIQEGQHDWVLLETISIPALGTKMTSSTSLNNGETYKFVASGTCNWRVPPSSGGYLGDAEYWLRHDAYGEGWTHMGIWSLAMWNGVPVEIEWGLYNDAHIYEIMYTPSANGPVTFFFNDDVYSDNSGFLTVNIYEWV